MISGRVHSDNVSISDSNTRKSSHDVDLSWLAWSVKTKLELILSYYDPGQTCLGPNHEKYFWIGAKIFNISSPNCIYKIWPPLKGLTGQGTCPAWLKWGMKYPVLWLWGRGMPDSVPLLSHWNIGDHWSCDCACVSEIWSRDNNGRRNVQMLASIASEQQQEPLWGGMSLGNSWWVFVTGAGDDGWGLRSPLQVVLASWPVFISDKSGMREISYRVTSNITLQSEGCHI